MHSRRSEIVCVRNKDLVDYSHDRLENVELFQSLCFCVRDFKAPEEYAYGEEGGREYMEHVLNVTPFSKSLIRN